MRKIHQDVLKGMLGGVKRRTAAHHEAQMAPCMIPRAMAAQIMEKVIEAAKGEYAFIYQQLTKNDKLAVAEVGTKALMPQGGMQFEMLRFPVLEFVSMLQDISDLARDIRTGEIKLHMPEYENICVERITKFMVDFNIEYELYDEGSEGKLRLRDLSPSFTHWHYNESLSKGDVRDKVNKLKRD